MNLQFIKTIFRRSLKNKAVTYINLFGLSAGLIVILMLVNVIRYEKGVNKFHDRIDDIYCIVTRDQHTGSNSVGGNETVPALPKIMMEEIPEVEYAALVRNGQGEYQFTIGNKIYKEKIQFASPNLFNVFSFPVISGKIPPDSNEKHVIALSKSMAQKLFGEKDPVGELIQIDNSYDFRVVAVFDDIPDNSTIRFDCWGNIEFLCELYNKENYLDTWYNLSFQAYVLLSEEALPESVNQKLEGRIIRSNPDSEAESQLYPFSDLYTDLWGRNDSIKMVGVIVAIILILVSINFINLKTVDTFQRIREFGVRKINGAGRGFLIKQLISESGLVILFSLVIAFFIAYFSFPALKNFIQIKGDQSGLVSFSSILILLAIAGFIATVSALIPSLSLRSGSPINSLNLKVSETVGVSRLRKILTGVQFWLATGLIIFTLFIVKQINYLKKFNLGFNKEQMVCIDLEGQLQTNYDLVQDELLKNANILHTTAASRHPIGIYWNGDGLEWDGKPDNVDPLVTFIETDEHFCKTFDVKMVAGDYFKTRQSGVVVVNETFANIISPEGNALNMKLSGYSLELEIAGIAKDFHFKPLNREIGPLMFIKEMGLDNMKYLFIRISPTDISNTLKYIEETVKKLNPEFTYSYSFLDDEFAKLYDGQERLKRQLSLFSLVAIIISVMGLWGVLLFVVQQRVKEIGIRKVNGAKVYEILSMLNKDFIRWVAIAFIIACPVAWYVINLWLDNFAYKTDLNWWVFALAGLLALGIALLTVSWQSWRAATRNPVEALRYE